MSFYKRSDGIWQFDKVKNGRRITISGKVREERAAWKIVKAKLQAMQMPQFEVRADPAMLPDLAASKSPRARGTSLGMVSAQYLYAAKEKIKVRENYRSHAAYVNLIVERLGPERDLYSITEMDLIPIVRELESGEKPRKAGTINSRVLLAVRPLFRYAHLTLGIRKLCMVDWRLVARSEDRTRVRYLKKNEMARLLAAVRDRDGHLHQFAWITGFRASEIINLRWSDIDWDHRLITTRVKGGRLHSVPLTRRLEKLIKELQPGGHSEFVFTYECERSSLKFGNKIGVRYKYTYCNLNRRFLEAVRKANITNYRFHDHRHTAATMVLLATGNIRLVQALLGHRNIATCERYAHLDVKAVARELERIDATDLPHAAMAELLATADLEPQDALRMQDVLRDNIKLLRQVAHLVDENRELRLAIAGPAA